jgi:CDGSH-type Zn-finger protein
MPEPKPRQNAPYVVDLEPDQYIWCGCGLSKNEPFCDNAHKGTEFADSDRAAMLFEVEGEAGEKKTVALCGCKRTNNPPYCDGTHAL